MPKIKGASQKPSAEIRRVKGRVFEPEFYNYAQGLTLNEANKNVSAMRYFR